jgi:hypothetical protein
MSLEPLREKISDNRFEQLTNCLAVCLGVDALMVLRDICGISGGKAEKLIVRMAMAIVEHGLNDADNERRLLAEEDMHPPSRE